MALTDAFVNHPRKILSANIITLMIISIIVVFHLDYMTISEQTRRDYLDWDHKMVIADDKWYLMMDFIS